jgi:hypothetical protein
LECTFNHVAISGVISGNVLSHKQSKCHYVVEEQETKTHTSIARVYISGISSDFTRAKSSTTTITRPDVCPRPDPVYMYTVDTGSPSMGSMLPKSPAYNTANIKHGRCRSDARRRTASHIPVRDGAGGPPGVSTWA